MVRIRDRTLKNPEAKYAAACQSKKRIVFLDQ